MPTLARHLQEGIHLHGSRHPQHWENFWKSLADSCYKMSKVDYPYAELGRSVAQFGLITYILGLIGGSTVGLVRSQEEVKNKLWSLPSLPREYEREWWKHIRIPEKYKVSKLQED